MPSYRVWKAPYNNLSMACLSSLLQEGMWCPTMPAPHCTIVFCYHEHRDCMSVAYIHSKSCKLALLTNNDRQKWRWLRHSSRWCCFYPGVTGRRVLHRCYIYTIIVVKACSLCLSLFEISHLHKTRNVCTNKICLHYILHKMVATVSPC